MSPIISLAIMPGGHSTDLPPVDKNEFNPEIYGYMTQIHQRQMQQRAQSSSKAKVPNDVQQALNLNDALLTFTQRLVEGIMAEQLECTECSEIHQAWLCNTKSSDPHEQVFRGVEFLDKLVHEHEIHAADGTHDFRIFKLSASAILGKLQAAKRLQSRMEDIVKELWPPSESFKRDDVASPDEMLLLEWKVVKYSLKTLYHHYLYFLKCVDAAEAIENGYSEVVVAQVEWEKERFDKAISLLPSQFEHEFNNGKQPVNEPRGFIAGTNSVGVDLPRSKLGASDTSSENVNVSSFQRARVLVNSNAEQETSSQMAEDACDRLLKSLSNITFEDTQPDAASLLSLSDTDSSLTNDSNSQESDIKEQASTHDRQTWARISRSWLVLKTGHTGFGSNALVNTDVGEVDGDNTQNPPRNSSNGKKRDQSANERSQSSSASLPKYANSGCDELDNGEESERDGRERKKQKQTSPIVSRGFACPYYKRDPKRPVRKRSCSTSLFPSIHRLKGHLYRAHKMPIHCNRCGLMFDDELSLISHHRGEQRCEKQELSFEGIDESQKEMLRSRKQTSKDEVEKWKDIYRILFPDDDELKIPSCYHDVQPKVIGHNDLALKQHVRSKLLDYYEYQREILPALIYSKLNTSGDVTGEDLSSVVEECLSNCLAEYQLSSEESGPSFARDGSFATGVGEASSSSQEAPNFKISNELFLQDTGLNQQSPRFTGHLGSLPEVLPFGGPESAAIGSFGYDASEEDPSSLGFSAFGYAFGPTTGSNAQNTFLHEALHDNARYNAEGASDLAVDPQLDGLVQLHNVEDSSFVQFTSSSTDV